MVFPSSAAAGASQSEQPVPQLEQPVLQLEQPPHLGRHFRRVNNLGRQQELQDDSQQVEAWQQGAGLASQHGAGFASQQGAGVEQQVVFALQQEDRVKIRHFLTGVQHRDFARQNNCASALSAPKERAIASMIANVAPPTANDRFIEISKGNEVETPTANIEPIGGKVGQLAKTLRLTKL